jgi:hypothetical protein
LLLPKGVHVDFPLATVSLQKSDGYCPTSKMESDGSLNDAEAIIIRMTSGFFSSGIFYFFSMALFLFLSTTTSAFGNFCLICKGSSPTFQLGIGFNFTNPLFFV